MSDEIEIRKQVINEVLAEFQKNCQRTYFKTVRIEVYCEPKCPYCDENRYIHVTAPNGQVLEDICKCAQKTKYVWGYEKTEVSTYSVGIPDGHAVILPVKTDYNGVVLIGYWVDPDPNSTEHPASFEMLYNSLFSTEEKLLEYCKATGVEMLTLDMDRVR